MEDYINSYSMEILDAQDELGREFYTNKERVSTDMASGVSLARLFQERLFKWRPWDTRTYLQYAKAGQYQNKPTELTGLLYRHLKLGVIGEEDRADGSSVDIGIYLNGNMKQFEKYNAMAEASWDEDFDFDPMTGRITDNTGTKGGGFARTLPSPSPHAVAVPDILLENDELVVPKPKVDWNLRAVWTINVKVEGDRFITHHNVTVPGRKTLFKGSQVDDNLSTLAMSMMHQVFGNTDLEGKMGDFGDGLRQLLAGEKYKTATSFAATPVLDTSTPKFWQGMIDLLMGGSKLTTVCGGLFLAYSVFDRGWNVNLSSLAVGASVMVVGIFLASVLTPYSYAQRKRKAAMSVGL